MRALIAGAWAAAASLSLIHVSPEPFVMSDCISIGGGPDPIHRRGKFKPNARRQKGRKTLNGAA